MSGSRKKNVFLTGATGNWGRSILREFSERADRFNIVALVLPSKKDRESIRQFADMPNLTVVYGDLTDYDAVERCVRGADYVLLLVPLYRRSPTIIPISRTGLTWGAHEISSEPSTLSATRRR